jgi:hypothetical protein
MVTDTRMVLSGALIIMQAQISLIYRLCRTLDCFKTGGGLPHLVVRTNLIVVCIQSLLLKLANRTRYILRWNGERA